ncbi:MAG TPA: AAA family ATPase [Candidatus Hydrogenedentes bacterium]|nr:AAA family ATPase [Candidatus Hydrogenedentota bacterium]
MRGRIDRVFFASPTFSAGRLKADGRDYISFAGNLFATEGDHVSLAGTWEKHSKYGRQFKVDHVAIEMPQDAEGLAQYLANHPEIKGIGQAKARAIAERFGGDFDRALEEQPEALAEAAHVPLTTIETLREHWRKTRNVNAALTWLSAYGLTYHQVSTLVEKLGNNVVAVLRDDPYLIIREVRGMGFKKVDQVARKLGTPKEHLPRVRAGVLHCVQEALDQGDCWVEYEDLIDRANTLLIMDCLDSRERIEKELDGLIDTERLACIDLGGRFVISLPVIHQMETDLARWFGEAHESNTSFAHIDDIEEVIARTGASLNARQREAVQQVLSSRISLISGGAGTGKTYTVSTLTAICDDHDLAVVLAAPTGKAAKRLEEASGRSATTIHRLLGYDGRSFAKGPDDVVDADLLIVDEVSMVDVPLAWHLFRSLDLTRTAVVLVGDHNQLPPVGPGNILRDLIQTRAIPSTILDKCVRQAGVLKENSTAILSGEVRKTSDKRPDGRCAWYLVDQFTDPMGVDKCLRELFENVLEEKLGFDILRDVQVLTPTHKGPLGTTALNEQIQRLVQRKRFGVEVPPHTVAGPHPSTITHGSRAQSQGSDADETRDLASRGSRRRAPLYPGDKVIQIRNNYDLGVMNGAVGFLREVLTDGTHLFEFDGAPVTIKKSDQALRDIQLGYCLSIHRAQGSEFPCVITVVHKAHSFMHHRNLFYTGVTRARTSAIILGDRWGVRNCAAKVQVDARKTFLSQFLRVNRPAPAATPWESEDLQVAAQG